MAAALIGLWGLEFKPPEPWKHCFWRVYARASQTLKVVLAYRLHFRRR